MIFSSNYDRRKVSPLIYIKFLREACLSALLYGTELFTLTPTLLAKHDVVSSGSLKMFSMFQSLNLDNCS